jgi:restriction system protein
LFDTQSWYPRHILHYIYYTKEAKDSSFQNGAVPIILIDENVIVDMMIEKKFGVVVEELLVYSNALDLILPD